MASGKYTTGTVYVAGSSNLTAANIKSGVSIFGVTGTLASGASTDAYASNIDSQSYAKSLTITVPTANVYPSVIMGIVIPSNANRYYYYSPNITEFILRATTLQYLWVHSDNHLVYETQSITRSISGTTLTITLSSQYSTAYSGTKIGFNQLDNFQCVCI